MFSIVVLSMRNAIARREEMARKLQGVNLKYDFFDAVDGRKLEAGDFYNKSINSNFWFNRRKILTPSEVGCTLSHNEILKEFVSNSADEWLIVLEDDVDIKSNFSQVLHNFCSYNSDKPFNGVLILGGQEGLKSQHLIFKIKSKKYFNHPFYLIPSFFHKWVYRTCGYAINKESAKKILDLKTKKNIVADDWSYIFKKTSLDKMYFTHLVVHPEDLSDSSIHNERIKK